MDRAKMPTQAPVAILSEACLANRTPYNRDMRRSLPLILLLVLAVSTSWADSPAFDLVGPKIDVHVKRGEVTLPISETPNLLPGDRLWIHPDFPDSQSERYVLVVAFLRGVTNPPPNDWFTRVETWTRQARNEGVFVNVPKEAQQALIFLVPETGGDFSTLRKAVHDRPGAFVRAGQDLLAASWDRMRLDAYLNEIRVSYQADPKNLKEHAEASARTLGIKLDQQCFDKPPEQQAPCLSQHTEGMVLDDANAQSLVSQLANGTTGDLMNQLSYSSMGGGGQFSPYIGAIVDTAKILASLHTAHFQYIPALALSTKDTLNLRLNLPPSFRDPKSVVVIALPPVGPSKAPPLHATNPLEPACAQKPDLILQADGAPMVFATSLAHDLMLHIETDHGPLDLPVVPAPHKGGLVLQKAAPPMPAGDLTGVVRGKWGFDDWEGPRFHLQSSGPAKWAVAPDDQSALIVGRDDTLHIKGSNTLCVSSVAKREPETSNSLPLKWKAVKADTLEVAVPLKDAKPGTLLLDIQQYGVDKPDTLDLDAYAEAASLEHLSLSAGDRDALLKGTRLDTVAKVTLNGITWTPANLARVQDFDQLTLSTEGSTLELDASKSYTAKVLLRDGRQLKVPVSVSAPRPQVTLLSKGTQEEPATQTPSPVRLGSPDDLPLSARLVFFLKSVVPQSFPRNQNIEVAAADGSFHTVLSLSDGSLMLEDSKTALATLDPLARFGSSAFGPLRARAVSANGVTGDWMPLGTLVRLPAFKELRCTHSSSKPCTLSGTNLFLTESISAAEDFSNATEVPPDFTGGQLVVPHPANGTLYLKLRDDPQTVQTLTLPVTVVAPTTPQPGPTTAIQSQPATAPSAPPAQPADPAAPTPKPEQ